MAMQGMMYPSTHFPMNVHHEGVNGPVEASWSAAPAMAYGFGAHSLPSNYHQLHYPGERGAQVHNFGAYDHRVGVKTINSRRDAHSCSQRSIAADRGSSKDNQTYWEQSKYAMQKQQLR
ncbi:hypothetical protein KEM55_005004 [Ascosphaera atra]|nr:hypothetical protein KEM55_005004 [Ascosphaera atra]